MTTIKTKISSSHHQITPTITHSKAQKNMLFPLIGLVVTLSLWSTILTLQPNDPREDYVRRLTSTIGITAAITGCFDLTNGIINVYGPGKGSNTLTGMYDLVNSGYLHTTATSTVNIPSKTAKLDSSRVTGAPPQSMRARLLIIVGGVLVMAPLPRINANSIDDSTLEEHHAQLDQSSVEMLYLLSSEAEPSQYEQMDSRLSSPLQLNPNSSEASTEPSQTSDSLGSASHIISKTSSGASSPTMSESTGCASSSFTTPVCITPQVSPVDYNHRPASQPVIPYYAGNDGLEQCTEPDVTCSYQPELKANLGEGKASLRGPVFDTITTTTETTTSDLEKPSTPEQDSTATIPKTRRRPRPSQAKRRRFTRQNGQALRLSALSQEAQVN